MTAVDTSASILDRLRHRATERAARLSAAGFLVEDERAFVVALTPPLPAGADR